MKNPVFFLLLLPILCLAQGTSHYRIAVLCDSLIAHIPDATPPPRLAVLPFVYEGDSSATGPGLEAAECVVAYMKPSKKVKLVDRMNFHKAVMELKLSGSALIEPSNALAVGKLESAQYLLVGNIGTLKGETRISAQIIDVETSAVIAAHSIPITVPEVQTLAKELFSEKSQVQSSILRSVVLPGWGQIYTEHYWRGGICLAAVAAAAGGTIYLGTATAKAKQEWHDWLNWMNSGKPYNDHLTLQYSLGVSDPVQRDNKRLAELHADYSRKYDRTMIAAGAMAALWVVNIIDASIAGVQAHRRFAPYFSADFSGRVSAAGVCIRF